MFNIKPEGVIHFHILLSVSLMYVSGEHRFRLPKCSFPVIELLQKVDQLMTSNKERNAENFWMLWSNTYSLHYWKKVLDKCLCANFAICHIVGSTVGIV